MCEIFFHNRLLSILIRLWNYMKEISFLYHIFRKLRISWTFWMTEEELYRVYTIFSFYFRSTGSVLMMWVELGVSLI